MDTQSQQPSPTHIRKKAVVIWTCTKIQQLCQLPRPWKNDKMVQIRIYKLGFIRQELCSRNVRKCVWHCSCTHPIFVYRIDIHIYRWDVRIRMFYSWIKYGEKYACFTIHFCNCKNILWNIHVRTFYSYQVEIHTFTYISPIVISYIQTNTTHRYDWEHRASGTCRLKL